MALCSTGFPWLSEISPEALSEANEVIYILDRDLRIVYCNPAWDRFALGNGGEDCVAEKTVGKLLTDCISPELQTFYQSALHSCLNEKATVGLDYECSSPSIFRLFHMQLIPLKHWDGAIVINALRVECEHTRGMSDRPLREYVNDSSVARLCANCRRAWNYDQHRWDWVPCLLDAHIRVSHALCPVCLDYTYRMFIQRPA